MPGPRSNKSAPRIDVVVAHVDETEQHIRVNDFEVAFVQCVQTDELAGKCRGDELTARANLDRSVWTNAMHLGHRIFESWWALGITA